MQTCVPDSTRSISSLPWYFAGFSVSPRYSSCCIASRTCLTMRDPLSLVLLLAYPRVTFCIHVSLNLFTFGPLCYSLLFSALFDSRSSIRLLEAIGGIGRGIGQKVTELPFFVFKRKANSSREANLVNAIELPKWSK